MRDKPHEAVERVRVRNHPHLSEELVSKICFLEEMNPDNRKRAQDHIWDAIEIYLEQGHLD